MRRIRFSDAFSDFYEKLSDSEQSKVNYLLRVISKTKVVNNKIVKKLQASEFYELRIKSGNEYRVIVFTIDNNSFIESSEIILLNGFMKKSTKDYRKQIKIAESIIKNLEL